MALTDALNKEILRRLSKWAMGSSAPPTRMVILPTNRCNLRCLFCGGVYEREDPNFTYDDEISRERWIEIIEEASKFGVVEWLIGGGGEPLVRADTVIEMIKTIKRTNPFSTIELSTNGTLITPSIARDLVAAGCDYIQTGIDGPNAEIHDFLRGKGGAFEATSNGIRYLAMAKKELGKDKPIIKIHVVLNSKNYDKLPEMIALGHSVGANFFAVAAMRVYGGGQEKAVEETNLRMNDEQKRKVHKVWKEVEKFAAENNMMLGPAFQEGMEEVSEVFEYKENKENHMDFQDPKINQFLSAFCYAPFYGLIVDWAGNVGPCPCAGSVKNTGNNLKTKSVEEIWHGDFFKDVRKCMIRGEPIKLENILIGKDVRGLPQHPCESCGINIERYEMVQWLRPIIKDRIEKQRCAKV